MGFGLYWQPAIVQSVHWQINFVRSFVNKPKCGAGIHKHAILGPQSKLQLFCIWQLVCKIELLSIPFLQTTRSTDLSQRKPSAGLISALITFRPLTTISSFFSLCAIIIRSAYPVTPKADHSAATSSSLSHSSKRDPDVIKILISFYHPNYCLFTLVRMIQPAKTRSQNPKVSLLGFWEQPAKNWKFYHLIQLSRKNITRQTEQKYSY